MYATCETTDCGNLGAPIHVPDDHGTVICGVCGVPVTLLGENAPAEPKEMPTWEL